MYPKHFLDYFRDFETKEEVFVAMPFQGEAAERRWEEIFTPAIEAVDLTPFRVDARGVGDSILTDILDGIGRARLVLGDLSTDPICEEHDGTLAGAPNHNVLYEVGIAHAERMAEEVIVVRDSNEPVIDSRIPFDVLHVRYREFDSSDTESARERIAGYLADALEEIDRTQDLIVDRTLRRLGEEETDFIFNRSQRGWFDPWIDHDGEGDPRTFRREVVRRLLDLRVLEAEQLPGQVSTRYQFTELGRTLGRILRSRAGTTVEDGDR